MPIIAPATTYEFAPLFVAFREKTLTVIIGLSTLGYSRTAKLVYPIIPKRIINPPIKTIEFIADNILLDNTSPSVLKVILLFITS